MGRPKNNSPCSVEGCKLPYFGKGLCNTHYQRNVKHGDPLALKRCRGQRNCAVEGCKLPHFGKGYCNPHYRAWKKNGNPIPLLKSKKIPKGTICTIADCTNQMASKSYCDHHYKKLYRYGDPLHQAVRRVAKPKPLFLTKKDLALRQALQGSTLELIRHKLEELIK